MPFLFRIRIRIVRSLVCGRAERSSDPLSLPPSTERCSLQADRSTVAPPPRTMGSSCSNNRDARGVGVWPAAGFSRATGVVAHKVLVYAHRPDDCDLAAGREREKPVVLEQHHPLARSEHAVSTLNDVGY